MEKSAQFFLSENITPWDSFLASHNASTFNGFVKERGLEKYDWEVSTHWDATDLKAAEFSAGAKLEDLLFSISLIYGIKPHIKKIETAISELFFNALDHGVLSLSSSLKSSAEGFVEYYQIRSKKLASLEEGSIDICVKYIASKLFPENKGELKISVKDSGDGFNFEKFMKDALPVKNSTAHFGRGLMLVSSLCEKVEFYDGGSRVEASIFLTAAH